MKRISLTYPAIFLLILTFAAGLIAYPEKAAEAVRTSLHLCATSVIPSLFPFFVVAKLVTGLRFTDIFGKVLNPIMRPLFSLSGNTAPALALGLIGGYPVGAATAALIYEGNGCTSEETERILAFCNNCGPAFIIGAIGSGVFSSTKAGTVLLLIHMIAAITVGLIFRIISPIRPAKISFKKNNVTDIPNFSSAFTEAVLSSLNSSLSISAYIVLFSVLVCITKQTGIINYISYLLGSLFGTGSDLTEAVMSGLLEMTVGIYSLTNASTPETAFVITSFLLGWGGLSVHAQTLSCISKHKLKTHQYFIGKALHGIISAVLAFIYICTTKSLPVFASTQLHKPYHGSFIAFAVLILLFYIFCKKGWKKAK